MLLAANSTASPACTAGEERLPVLQARMAWGIWAGSLGSEPAQQSSLVDARGQDVGGGSAVDAAEVKLVGVGFLEGLAHKVGLRAALPGEVWRWREVHALHTRTDEERGGESKE